MNIRLQTSISTIGITAQFFFQWLIGILLVRLDGYGTAGIFSLAMSISNVFSYFGNYGLRNFQITDAKHSFSDAQYILMRTGTCLAALLACCGYLSIATGYSQTERLAILWYCIYTLTNTMADTILGSIQVRNHFEVTGYSCAFKGALNFIFFLVSFWCFHNIVLSLALMALGSAIVIGYDVCMYRRYVGLLTVPATSDIRKVARLLQVCFPLMMAQVLPIMTTAVPRRTIQNLLGAELLGIFSSVFTPTVVISTLAPSLVMAVLPQFAADWKSGRYRKLAIKVGYGVGAFAVGAVAAMAVVILCGRFFMELIFGPSILDYFSLMYWAVLASICSAFTAFLNGVLTAIRHTGYIAPLTVFTLGLTVLCSQVLVQEFGIYGAAYIQIATYTLQGVLQLIIVGLLLLKASGLLRPHNKEQRK